MNVQSPLRSSAAVVPVVDSTRDLAKFLSPSCPALIWNRQTPVEVQTWLDTCTPEHLPRGRMVLPAEAVAEAVAQMCDTAQMPQGPERAWLESDVTGLAATFAALVGAKHLRLRVDVVTTNACRKFHVDAITARLVCTYRGTGTQFGTSPDRSDPEVVHTVATGAPILLRGTLWPETPATGLLHRSPPIEGTGTSRLVLVLDPIFDTEDEV